MKNAKTNISLSPFIKNEIKELKEDARKSKKKYKITAITLSLLNLALIAVAATAIDLLIVYHSKHPGGSEVGVILTSFAAALFVIMFFLQFGITIFRSKRKEDVYKDALDEIQLEVIKHHRGIEDYKRKTADKLLEERCTAIKDTAIEHKHKKSIGSLILKGLTGGEDA